MGNKDKIVGLELLEKYNIHSLMAIKFGKKAHNKDILDGKLYLNTVEYFRDLEESKLVTRGIGDSDDSCFVLSNGHLEIYDDKNGDRIMTVPFTKGKHKTCGDKNLFCLYIMDRDNIKKAYIGENGKALFIEAGFTEQQKADIMRLLNNPESALFILNEKDFMASIIEAVKQKGSKCTFRRVTYRDNRCLTPDYVESYGADNESMTFYKDVFFSPEHEFRICFESMDLREEHFLDCKPIKGNIFLLDIDKAFDSRFLVRYTIN